MDQFSFPKIDTFRNRQNELSAMESWWSSKDPNALLVYGRRRVGKSWLIRRFAHGKPTIFLVGERLPPGTQLRRFAAELAPRLSGAIPEINDVADLFRLLLALSVGTDQLIVIDELPYLLPSTEAARERSLTAIQAVLEERDGSAARLVLCGSHIAIMEGMMRSGSGLSGRLRPLPVHPMSLRASRAFIDDQDPAARVERYAVAGGMARYLSLLGSGGSLRQRICETVLDPNGPLFNDPRDVLEHELRQTDNYFGLLEALSAKREMAPNDLAAAVKRNETSLPPFLRTLQEMKLVERKLPFGAGHRSHGQYRLCDPFLRFWFRCVFPFQESLGAGLEPTTLWDSQIREVLPQHVSWTFEDLCRYWTRLQHGHAAPIVRPWWGAAGPRRKDPNRNSEEIDIVGGINKKVTIVGECKWTTRPMGADVLDVLREHKLPALAHGKLTVAPDVTTVLFSRSGFTPKLQAIAADATKIELIDADRLVNDLLA